MQQCYLLPSLMSPSRLPNSSVCHCRSWLSEYLFSSNRPSKDMTYLRCRLNTQVIFLFLLQKMGTLTLTSLGRFGT